MPTPRGNGTRNPGDRDPGSRDPAVRPADFRQPGGTGRPDSDPGRRPGTTGIPPARRPGDGGTSRRNPPTGGPGRGPNIGDRDGGWREGSGRYNGYDRGRDTGDYGQYSRRERDRDTRDHNWGDNRRDYRTGNSYYYTRNSRHSDHRRWDWAQRRHNFYRDHHRHNQRIRWVAHLNTGWSNSRYYGHYGPSNNWRYHRKYYDYGYDRRQFAYYNEVCRYDRNGNGAAIGALLGALIGGAAAHDDDVGVGILLGAGFGAILGASVTNLDDCDRAQYHYGMNYAFEYGQPYYWGNPNSGVRGSIVIRETYYYGGAECRWGDAEIYMPDGTYNYDRVRMCRDRYGDWQVANHQ